MRTTKSYTIESEIIEYIDGTKGDRSVSERVNELLKRAILEERCKLLEAKAQSFFANASTAGRAETLAFQNAALQTFDRD